MRLPPIPLTQVADIWEEAGIHGSQERPVQTGWTKLYGWVGNGVFRGLSGIPLFSRLFTGFWSQTPKLGSSIGLKLDAIRSGESEPRPRIA